MALIPLSADMSIHLSDVDKYVKALQKYKYEQKPRQQGKTLISEQYQQKWKTNMGCRNFEDEMNALRRCDCNQCREKYYGMEREYYRGRNYDNYTIPYMTIPQLTMEPIKVEAKIEEPKNYAVKLLVDQLKAQQTNLTSKASAIASDKSMIKTYQAALKTKNGEKLGIENKIKELAGALKKLGHKE